MHKAIRYVLLALLTLALTSGLAFAQNSMDERGIHVTGMGTVYGEPDLALLDFGIDIVNEDLSLAIDAANTTMAEIMEELVEAGVDQVDIRTTDFNIRREERYGPDREPLEPVYHVVNVVRVTVREVDRAGELLSVAIEAGANEVRNISYTFSNPAELERQARTLAMQDARETAEQLARLAGVELGGVKEIHENDLGPPIPFAAQRSFALEAADAVPVSGGQLAVEVRLQVTFDIEEGVAAGE